MPAKWLIALAAIALSLTIVGDATAAPSESSQDSSTTCDDIDCVLECVDIECIVGCDPSRTEDPIGLVIDCIPG